MISFIDLKEEKTALYLNFPFCKSPCSYCHYIDNLKFGYTTIPDEYVEMITIQLEYVLKQLSEKKLESIYFGGGTPSLLSNEQIKKIEEVFDKYQITSKLNSLNFSQPNVTKGIKRIFFTFQSTLCFTNR